MSDLTPQHPAAPETETDANGLTDAERKSLAEVVWPNNYADPDLDAVAEIVERIVAERVRAVEGERDAEKRRGNYWRGQAAEYVVAATEARARAESAEDAHEAEKAAHERLRAEFSELADDFASNVDWSAGRGNYGDNEAWERAAREVRSLLGGGEAR